MCPIRNEMKKVEVLFRAILVYIWMWYAVLLGDITATNTDTSIRGKAVIGYAHYRKEIGQLLPSAYRSNVRRRWGVDVHLASSLLTIAMNPHQKGLLSGNLPTPIKLSFYVP